MEQNIILFMSLSGSVVFLFYLSFNPLLRKYTSVKWRYMILKITMVFYLFPFAYFRTWIHSKLLHLFPLMEVPQSGKSQVINDVNSIVIGKTIQVPSEVWIVWLAIGCSALLSFTFIAIQLLQYKKAKKRRLGQGVAAASSEQREWMLSVQKEIGLRKNVKLVFSIYEQMPMTVGFFSPTVLLPMLEPEEMNTETWDYIMRHELFHIKNRDLLCKFIALMVMSLHWFNPLCYLLFSEICTVGEMVCDAEVIKGKSDEHRQEYSHLIIKTTKKSTNNFFENFFISMGLADNGICITERRILEMKQKKTVRRGLPFIVGVIICMMGAMPTFAYNAPSVVKIINTSMVQLSSTRGQFMAGSQMVEDEELPYERCFIDEQGNIYECKKNQEKVLCDHSMVAGTYIEHNRFSDGSCEKLYYYSSRCKVCGYIELGDCFKTTSYPKCTH